MVLFTTTACHELLSFLFFWTFLSCFLFVILLFSPFLSFFLQQVAEGLFLFKGSSSSPLSPGAHSRIAWLFGFSFSNIVPYHIKAPKLPVVLKWHLKNITEINQKHNDFSGVNENVSLLSQILTKGREWCKVCLLTVFGARKPFTTRVLCCGGRLDYFLIWTMSHTSLAPWHNM